MVVPDVACIDKERAIEGAVNGETQFGIALQLDVADAFNVVVVVFGVIGSGTQLTVFPSTHPDGASRIEAALERHVIGVAVGDAATYQLAANEPGFFAQLVILPEVDVATKELGITDAQQLVMVILGCDQ